jgi:hypothetical protein
MPDSSGVRGLYIGGGKTSPMGDWHSDVPATALGRISAGGIVFGPIYINGGQLLVTGTTINPNGLFVNLNASSNQTISTITADGTFGELVTFVNGSTYLMTFQFGTFLRTTSPTVVLEQYDTLTMLHIGNGIWVEVARNVRRPVMSSASGGTIAAGTTILATTALVTVAPGSNITMTATPTFTNGATGGQELTIINSAANTLEIQDEISLTGSNLRLSAASIVLGQYDSIKFIWFGDKWNQISQVNVL